MALNTEKFIIKAVLKHNALYSYEKSIYTGCFNKVIITCKIHGDFEQTPGSHLYGCGCPKCRAKLTSDRHIGTNEAFINKAKEKFGEKFDYTNVQYKKSNVKVIIGCPIHGMFEQTPNDHLTSNTGCSECSKEIRASNRTYTNDIFIKKANKIHNFKYDYLALKYVDGKTNVIITCPVHGAFEQNPVYHLQGQGCRKCGLIKLSKSSTSNTEEFIQKAKLVHGDKYNYDNVDYKASRIKVSITCPEHGDFLQTPNGHLNGRSCSQCGIEKGIGFKSSDFVKKYTNGAIFYIVKLFNEKESFIKIGITGKSIRHRMYSISYKYEMLHEIFTKSKNVVYLEKHIKRKVKALKYIPTIEFGGWTECFTQESLPEIKNYLFNF